MIYFLHRLSQCGISEVRVNRIYLHYVLILILREVRRSPYRSGFSFFTPPHDFVPSLQTTNYLATPVDKFKT